MKKSRFRAVAVVISILFTLQALPVNAAAPAPDMPPDARAAVAVQANNPFSINYEGCDEYFQLYRNYLRLYAAFDTSKIETAINALPKLSQVKELSKEKAVASFTSVETYNTYKKHIYELRPNELRFDGVGYTLTTKQYENLKTVIDAAAADKENPKVYFPQWLVWMNPNRVTGMTYIGKDGKTANVLKENLWQASNTVRSINVTAKTETFDPKKIDIKKLKDSIRYHIDFNSGVTYEVVMHEGKLYVQSSDKDFGCLYNIKSQKSWDRDVDSIKKATTNILPPLTGKPVIYLYPENTRDVSVKLDFKGKLRVTEPVYDGGWDVTASPDGAIVNKADGKAYPYLFWDGDPYFNNWDFSTGFCVKGSEMKRFLIEKLPALGLNKAEYDEFIEYWEPLLSKNEYNLITFATSQYEAIAPLAIAPAPDALLRVHMVYKPLEAPVDIAEQVLPAAPQRTGFTVVEWGATKAQ